MKIYYDKFELNSERDKINNEIFECLNNLIFVNLSDEFKSEIKNWRFEQVDNTFCYYPVTERGDDLFDIIFSLNYFECKNTYKDMLNRRVIYEKSYVNEL